MPKGIDVTMSSPTHMGGEASGPLSPTMSAATPLVNLLYMEDFDPEVDPDFIKKELRPYFASVFADLALRSTQ